MNFDSSIHPINLNSSYAPTPKAESQSYVRWMGHKISTGLNELKSFSPISLISSMSEKIFNHLPVIFTNKYFFTLAAVQDKELKAREEASTTPNGVYDHFASVHKGHPRGGGDCPMRAFASVKSLIGEQDYTYRHNARALIVPHQFEKYYSDPIHNDNKKFQLIDSTKDDQFKDFPNGSVFILARPLMTTVFINHSLNKINTSSQLSHFCTGIKINGKMYVLELNRKPATLFEPLDAFQQRLSDKKTDHLNLFLHVGSAHSRFSLNEPRKNSNLSDPSELEDK